MAVDPFLEFLGFEEENPDYDHVERAFVERVKSRIQDIQTSYDEEEVKKTDQWLTAIHQQFFNYTLHWIADRIQTTKNQQNHPDAPGLKKQAQSVMEDLQTGIINFASCYMHINRFMIIIRDEIKKESISCHFPDSKDLKWSPDAGEMIKRHKKRKTEIEKQEECFDPAKKALSKIDIDGMRQNCLELFGKEKGEVLQRRFVSSLRTANFSKAKKTLGEIKAHKKRFGLDKKTAEELLNALIKAGTVAIDTVSSHIEYLGSDDNKLFLKPEEIDNVKEANKAEIQKINLYLAKYHLPYMQYKLNALQHLQDRLLVLGSLEKLMTLYKQLSWGIANPLPDLKTVRHFESDILDKSSYLLSGHLKDVGKIKEWAGEEVDEFRKSRKEFQEIEQSISMISSQTKVAKTAIH